MVFNKLPYYALATCFFGILSFALGIAAELRKPPSGNPMPGNGVVICSFPNDPSAILGFLSIVTMFVTSIFGFVSIFVSYGGIVVPPKSLFENSMLYVFFHIAIAVTIGGAGMTLWATLTELLHQLRNVHFDLDTMCPTAKTGLFGGAAFIHLNAMLMWLVCQLLTSNAREDHFRPDDDQCDDNNSTSSSERY